MRLLMSLLMVTALAGLLPKAGPSPAVAQEMLGRRLPAAAER